MVIRICISVPDAEALLALLQTCESFPDVVEKLKERLAIRQIAQAEWDRDASRYVHGIVHTPTVLELEDVFRTEAK